MCSYSLHFAIFSKLAKRMLDLYWGMLVLSGVLLQSILVFGNVGTIGSFTLINIGIGECWYYQEFYFDQYWYWGMLVLPVVLLQSILVLLKCFLDILSIFYISHLAAICL